MAVLCIFLGAACGYDYKINKIPNYLIGFLIFWGLVYCGSGGGLWGMLLYLGKMILVGVLFFPFFSIGAIGAGDIKLLGVTAGYLPFEKILIFIFISMLVAAVISLMKMCKWKQLGKRMRYIVAYLTKVFRQGRWQLYPEQENEQHSKICLSGPILCGVLLYLGGIY